MKKLQAICRTAAFCLAAASPSSITAQTPYLVPFQPDVDPGGRAVAVTIDPTYSFHAIAASEAGGLFVTYDSVNWRHLRNCPMFYMSDVKFAPVSPHGQVIVIATSTGDGRRDSSGGIWRSVDGGVIWQRPTGGDPGCTALRSAYGIAFSPDGARAYVGTDCGIAISLDSGATWSHRAESSAPVWAIAAQHSGSEDVVDFSTPTGAYKRLGVSSTGNIREISRIGPPGDCSSVHAVAIPPTQPNVVFVAVRSRLYEGDYDAGGHVTWREVTPPTWDGRRSRGAWVAITQWDHGNPQVYDVYASDGYRFFRQTCIPTGTGSGCTFDRWLSVNVPPLLDLGNSQKDNDGMAFHPDTGLPAYVAADGGLYTPESASPTRYGLDWVIHGRRGFTALEIYQVTGQIIAARRSASGACIPGHTDLYFGTQDNGYLASGDGGAHWPFETGNEGGGIELPRYARASNLSPSSGANLVVRDDAAYGIIASEAYWQNERPWAPAGMIGHPTLISPNVYLQVGTNAAPERDGLRNLNITRDQGRTWQKIANNLPSSYGELRVSMNADHVTIYGTAPRDLGAVGLWKLSGIHPDGSVDLPSPPSAPLLPISRADVGLNNLGLGFDALFGVDPNDPGHILAVDLGAHQVRVSRDGGLHWGSDLLLTDLVTGPDPVTHVRRYYFDYLDLNRNILSQITAIAFDPYYRGHILVGTESAGIFRSTDGGGSWAAIAGSTEATKITSFFFIENHCAEPNDTVIVATYARGLWKLILPPGTASASSPAIRAADAGSSSLAFGLPLDVATKLGALVVDASTGLPSPDLLLNVGDNPHLRWLVVAGGKVQDIVLEEGAQVAGISIDGGRVVASSADARPIVPPIPVQQSAQTGSFIGCPGCEELLKGGGSVLGLVLEDGTLRAVLGGVAPVPGESSITTFNPPPSDPPPAPDDVPPSGPNVEIVNSDSSDFPRVAFGDSLTLYGAGFCGAAECSLVSVQIGGISVANGIPVGTNGTFQVTVSVPVLRGWTGPGQRDIRSELRASQSGEGNQVLQANTFLIVSIGADPGEEGSPEPPGLLSAGTFDGTSIGACFDQAVTQDSAENVANYVVNGGAIPVLAASLREDLKSVQLRLGGILPPGGPFILFATNLLSLSGNSGGGTVMGLAPNYRLTALGLGQLMPTGAVFSCEGGSIEVAAEGAGQGWSGDPSTFVSRPLTGDFDVRANLILVNGPDGAIGGIAARESASDPGARSVGLFLIPDPNAPLNYLEASALVRSIPGTSSVSFGTADPVSLPPAPIFRLQRSGHLFTAMVSEDGNSWSVVGQTNTAASPLAATLFVGFGAAAPRSGQTAIVEFRDFQFGQPSAPCLELTCPPANLVVDCVNAAGTVVNYGVTGWNLCNPADAALTCVPPSDYAFPRGTTPVLCTLSGSGQTTQCVFNVVVLSNCPPCITVFCPTNRDLNCTNATLGTVVNYGTITATNLCYSANFPTTWCWPPSGYTFTPGTWAITCYASALVGSNYETNQCSFTVLVRSNCPPAFQANLLVYDSFEYQTNTQVIGQKGGLGWTTPWGGLNPVFNYFTNQALSLLPPGVPWDTAGGSAVIDLPPNSFNYLQRGLDLETTNRSELWFSLVISASGESAGDRFLVYFNDDQQTSVEAGAYAAGSGLPAHWSINQTTGQGPLVKANEPTLLVVQMINLSLTTHRFNLFANPPPASVGPIPPDATYLSQGLRMDRVKLLQYIVNGGGTHHALDEIRIGPSYADINPPPVPCLQVSITDPPACASGPAAHIQGAVSGCANLAKLTWTGSDNLEHTICENCGMNPNFAFDLPVSSPCAEVPFTVTAYDALGGSRSLSSVVPADHTPPTMICPSDVTLHCSEALGTRVDYAPSAFDPCGLGSLDCTPHSGSIFPLGTTLVNCLASDACGNSAACTFSVTALSDCPPACSGNLLVNGSFENPGVPDGFVALPGGDTTVAGWTTLFNGLDYYNPVVAPSFANTGRAAEGNYLVDLAPLNASDGGGIQQTFATVQGRSYHVSFAMGTSQERGRNGSASLTVSVAGSAQDFNVSTTSPEIVWQRQSFDFVAINSSSTLAFSSIDDPALAFVNLDDVRVTDCCVELTCPGKVTAECQTPNGAPVAWTVFATNHCGANLVVTCSPPASSWFPPGTSWVTCTASADGATQTCTFPVIVTGSCAAECEANLLINGSFEQPGKDDGYQGILPSQLPNWLPGWTVLPAGIEYGDPTSANPAVQEAGVAADGSFIIDLAYLPGLPGGGIEQTVATTPNALYNLSFFLGTFVRAPRVEGTAHLTVAVNGEEHSFEVLNLGDQVAWTRYSVPFRASSPSTTVRFETPDDPLYHFVDLDDVRLARCDTNCIQIHCPGNITAYACGSDCVPVPFSVTAINLCGPSPVTVVTDFPSGYCFPLGTTWVHAMAFADGQTNQCSFSVTMQPCCAPPPPGLVLWLPFDEESGNVAYNYAAPYDGVLKEGLFPAAPGAGPAHVGGYVQNALHFDGLDLECCNDAVRVPDYPAVNIGTGDFSLDAWITMDPTNFGPRMILAKYNSDAAHPPVTGILFGTYYRRLLLQVFHDGTATAHVDTQLIPADGTWHFVGVTVRRDRADGVQFYVDGVPTGSSDPTVHPGNLSVGGPVYVGGDKSRNWQWAGHIDEVEMFNRKLEASEMLSLYSALGTGKCRVSCSVPGTTSLCPDQPAVTIQASIHNAAELPVVVSYQFGGLPGDGVKTFDGPTQFSPNAGKLTIPGRGETLFSVTITRPSGMPTGMLSGYELVVSTTAGARVLASGGLLTLSNLCVTAPEGVITLTGLSPSSLQPFTVQNPGASPFDLSGGRLVVYGPGGQLDTRAVSLDGLPPGTPVVLPAGTIVPGLGTPGAPLNPRAKGNPPGDGSLTLSVSAAFVSFQPGQTFTLALQTASNGANTFETLGSIGLRNGIAPASPVPLTLSRGPNGSVTLTWLGEDWTLEEANAPNGPYIQVLDAQSGYTTAAPQNTTKFYRLKLP